jgi:hypothetical protein
MISEAADEGFSVHTGVPVMSEPLDSIDKSLSHCHPPPSSFRMPHENLEAVEGAIYTAVPFGETQPSTDNNPRLLVRRRPLILTPHNHAPGSNSYFLYDSDSDSNDHNDDEDAIFGDFAYSILKILLRAIGGVVAMAISWVVLTEIIPVLIEALDPRNFPLLQAFLHFGASLVLFTTAVVFVDAALVSAGLRTTSFVSPSLYLKVLLPLLYVWAFLSACGLIFYDHNFVH